MKPIVTLLAFGAFFLTTTNCFSQVNTQDSLALVDIYNNDNGVNWPFYAQWNLSTPVSTWYDVSVSNGRVTALDYIGGGQLKGQIPSSIGNLTGLTDLVLDGDLNGSIPESVGNLVNLTRISFQQNQLSGSIPASMGNLTNLTVLLLNNNQLSGSVPPSLGNLKKIEIFDLSTNKLSDSIPCTLDSFPRENIQYFGISNNAFTFAGMEGLADAYDGLNIGINNQAIIPLHLNGNTFSVSAGGTLGNNTYTWSTSWPTSQQMGSTSGDSTFTASTPGTYYVTVTNTLCSCDPFFLTLTSDSVTLSSLPVSILNFTGSWMKSSAALQWETTSEINSSYFNIQRSVDGINFSTKGKVAAAGNSQTDQKYTYNDEGAATLDVPNIYYRLQEVDKDGQITYSKVVALKTDVAAVTFSVYPNPAKNAVSISVNGESGQAIISIIDINGNKLQELNPTLQRGTVTSINTSSLSAGTYFIHVSINGKEFEQKLVKE
jgi:Leucine-rich repeat (LRR) protein